jgi:hypothetical protein
LTNQARLALGNCLKHGSELPVKPDPDDFWGEFTYAPMPNAITFHCRCGSVDVVPSALLRELRLYIDSRSEVVRIMAIDRTGL